MAGNGDAAIDCWLAARTAGTPFDRVLMDLHMPGIDGIEATRRIRALEAEDNGPRTPIIALTANASPKIARPVSPPAWTASWSNRSIATGSPPR